MNGTIMQKRTKLLKTLALLCTIIGIVVAVFGTVTAIMLASSAANLGNILITLQMMNPIFYNLLIPMLTGALTWLAVAVLIITALLALALIAGAQGLRFQVELADRVAALEARSGG